MSDQIRWVQTATHWGMYEVGVRDGQVRDIRPWSFDTHPSPIGRSIPGTLRASSRIRQPMVRESYLRRGPRYRDNRRGAEPFVGVDWDTAIDLAARAIDDVRQRLGNEAIFGGSYGWSSAGRFHHAQSQVHRFLNSVGGYSYSVNTYSTAALEVIAPHVLGGDYMRMFASIPTWEEIARHTRLVVAFGGMAPKNMQVNPGGVGDHYAVDRQRACRDAGVRFINIGPLREDSLDLLGAEWIQARPNSDTAIMLALAHVLVTQNLHDRDFAERCCVGLDKFIPYLTGESDGCPKTPEWAAQVSGASADRIHQLALDIAAHRTLITAAWSLQRAEHGEQPFWMAMVLAALSGSMGLPGGGFGTGYGAIHAVGGESRILPIAALPQGRNPVSTFIPVARIADMLLDPGATIDYNGQRVRYPDVRLVYWAGGNPFHHHQDLNKLVRAWQTPETIIVHEPWWNPLARHADIVFPVATPVERNDLAIGALDRYLVAMYKAVEPPHAVRTDFEIFAALADRLGAGTRFTEERDEMAWLAHIYAETRKGFAAAGVSLPDFEEFWRDGHVLLPLPDGKPLLCAALRADATAHPLATPSGKLEIYSQTIARFGYADCPPHPAWIEPQEWLGSALAKRFPLHLVSNQPRTRLHSQLDHGETSLASKVAGREPVLIHRKDAAARGIVTGDIVRIFNDRGACLAGAVLTDTIMRGAVALATGAWYDPEEPGVAGSLCVHGNPNVLTRDVGTSRLAQGPSAQSTLVEIERYSATPPSVKAFEPPPCIERHP